MCLYHIGGVLDMDSLNTLSSGVKLLCKRVVASVLGGKFVGWGGRGFLLLVSLGSYVYSKTPNCASLTGLAFQGSVQELLGARLIHPHNHPVARQAGQDKRIRYVSAESWFARARRYTPLPAKPPNTLWANVVWDGDYLTLEEGQSCQA
jgi:hypothetical protein